MTVNQNDKVFVINENINTTYGGVDPTGKFVNVSELLGPGISYAVANLNNSSSAPTSPLTLTSAGGDFSLGLYPAGLQTDDIDIEANAIRINSDGVYEISLNLSGWQVTSTQNLLWKIQKNGTTVATFSKRNTQTNNPDLLTGTAYISIEARDEITLKIASSGTTTLTFAANTSNCTMNITKIGQVPVLLR